MSSVNTDGLPPEMQERIAHIIEGAKQKANAAAAAQVSAAQPQPVPEPASAPKPPNLMDHTIALRQEVAAMSQQVAAIGQVTEAVGQAVGQLYAMFQSQTTPTDQGATYSQAFQEQVREDDY
tara:strand:- start:2238 stop:2603 length:366 start_codon:yes stop_codon:yes gene_type:complete